MATPQEAWGWTAWQRWSQMTEQERRDGGFHYVEGFKLLLHGTPPPTVTLPPGLTEVQVVADYLSELRGWVGRGCLGGFVSSLIRSKGFRRANKTRALGWNQVCLCLGVPGCAWVCLGVPGGFTEWVLPWV